MLKFEARERGHPARILELPQSYDAMTSSVDTPRGWHSRGYIPHFDGGDIVQAVTFRLADSLPKHMLERWAIELAQLEERKIELERRRRIEDYLDKGTGAAWLKDRNIARLIQNALLYFDGQRYRLPAWVVMPNQVHVLMKTEPGYSLSSIVHSWKSYTANEANRVLGRRGEFWQEDYFDRYIRNAKHFQDAIAYIENNPVKASLCARRADWEFSSAKGRLGGQDVCASGSAPETRAGKMPALPGK